MEYMGHHIFEKPSVAWSGETTGTLLYTACTYLENTDRLIYSYGSRTFLSGYDISDASRGGRGNIDCSTLVILVLAGIPYEKSPYFTGSLKTLKDTSVPLELRDLIDPDNIPERYIEIAERIGRPYLKSPEGIDMVRAEKMGISPWTIRREIEASGAGRRSVILARHFLGSGSCFSSQEHARPGDIVFFLSKSFGIMPEEETVREPQVVHVGIVSRDPAFMINSSGTVMKDPQGDLKKPAVSLDAVCGRRSPAFFARPQSLI